MSLVIILFAGLVGTSVMTGFSYLAGLLFQLESREPKLLNELLRRAHGITADISENDPPGWIIHYIIGFVFSGITGAYLWYMDTDPTWLLGIISGFFLGILGALGWLGMFAFHHSPPKINLFRYLVQLVIAHMFFGLGAIWIYRIFL